VVPLEIFGRHNMQNLSAAREVCLALGVTEDAFYEKIRDFKGASRRLECLLERNGSCIYHDFAHAPSKVQATIEAVAERFPSRKIIAILELHTYSSLNRQYLPQYRGSMDQADKGLVYFNPAAVKRKGLPPLSEQDIREAMGQRPALSVHHNVHSLEKEIRQHAGPGKVFLFMSSASFAGIDLHILADELCP
jgi:UDP-N-acetylmuramate: L-alanyl-gamma-D-glutamyl-meso-diaminopimelate ligase